MTPTTDGTYPAPLAPLALAAVAQKAHIYAPLAEHAEKEIWATGEKRETWPASDSGVTSSTVWHDSVSGHAMSLRHYGFAIAAYHPKAATYGQAGLAATAQHMEQL